MPDGPVQGEVFAVSGDEHLTIWFRLVLLVHVVMMGWPCGRMPAFQKWVQFQAIPKDVEDGNCCHLRWCSAYLWEMLGRETYRRPLVSFKNGKLWEMYVSTSN